MNIPLSRPDVHPEDIDAVVSVLRGPHLSLGPELVRFETAFAEALGTDHAVAVSSGTAALHLGLLGLGLQPGDEVITTPFSFIASANVILMAGGRPVFADIDPQTWNIGPEAAAAAVTARTCGLLPVHVFGQPANLPDLLALARRQGLWILEDACEALGARVDGRAVGTFGAAGTFAFYPNKQITTGEGGMLVTADARLADLARSLRNQGRSEAGGWLQHVRLGYNYRLCDILCALGRMQLARIDGIRNRRAQVAQWYRERLIDDRRLQWQRIDDDQISWFVMVVRLTDEYSVTQRDGVLDALRARGIACSNYFTPIHLQGHFVEQYGYRAGMFPVCERLSERTIALPFHTTLTESEVDAVCRTLRAVL